MPVRSRSKRDYTPNPDSLIFAVYCDGACHAPKKAGDLGMGGWGVHVVFRDGRVHEFGGSHPETTNNRMELTAAIEAAKFIQQVETSGSKVTVYSDSRYVIDGVTDWYRGWIRKGWVSSTGQPVKNQEFWEALIAVKDGANWEWCKGHSGIAGNDRADEIAAGYANFTSLALQIVDLSVLSKVKA